MVAVAQLVRASGCGSEGRRFDPDQSPQWSYGRVARRWSAKPFTLVRIQLRPQTQN